MLGKPIIAQVEDAMIDAIKQANGLGYKLKSIETYGGQFDDDTFDIVRALPAVWIAFAGTQKPHAMNTERGRWKVPATFAVMCGTRNVRGERDTRHGSANEVGTYQMIADMQALFVNQDLNLPIDFIAPGQVRTLFNTKVKGNALSVFAVEFHTAWIVTETRPDDLALLRVGMDYMLKPDDDVADASDLLTLQGA